MSIKSDSCYSKRTGEPLTEYVSEDQAREGADYTNSKYKNSSLAPYRCSKCNKWHLSPRDRQTPSIKCPSCTDSNGFYKDLYPSRKVAERRAGILHKERGVRLHVYKCAYHNGWHLTKG